jgi:4'-phosphopantetheinyl transferase
MTISAVGLAGAVPLSWPFAPSEIRLGQNEIHVWCASLNDFHGALSRFDAVLSAHERTRASKFHFAGDRDRFIARRGILRKLLARYLHQDAGTIEFSLGRFGKPYIDGQDGGCRLHFNASHSGALAVYTITNASPVGVDVERLREIPELDAIASRVVAPGEGRRLTALPRKRQLEEFFAGWTWKEAVLKASGEGIGAHFGARDGVRPCVPSDWRFQRLWPAPGYVGALAYRHDAARVFLWRVSDATVACQPKLTAWQGWSAAASLRDALADSLRVTHERRLEGR